MFFFLLFPKHTENLNTWLYNDIYVSRLLLLTNSTRLTSHVQEGSVSVIQSCQGETDEYQTGSHQSCSNDAGKTEETKLYNNWPEDQLVLYCSHEDLSKRMQLQNIFRLLSIWLIKNLFHCSKKRHFLKVFFFFLNISSIILVNRSEPLKQNIFPQTQWCFRQNLVVSGSTVSVKILFENKNSSDRVGFIWINLKDLILNAL